LTHYFAGFVHGFAFVAVAGNLPLFVNRLADKAKTSAAALSAQYTRGQTVEQKRSQADDEAKSSIHDPRISRKDEQPRFVRATQATALSPNTPSIMTLANISLRSKRQQCFAAPLSTVEVCSAQRVTSFEKISSLCHSLPTRCGHATEQLHTVGIPNKQQPEKLLQPIQSDALTGNERLPAGREFAMSPCPDVFLLR
jgi:hypothetical protein